MESGKQAGAWFAAYAAAVAALAWAGEARAQVFPLGGRTAQMGGAATASGRDSAMPYVNPAGLAGLPKDLFALSANIYGVSQFRIKPFFVKEFQFPTVVDEDTQRGQSIYQLPSSIMYLAKVSDPEAHVRHKLGISLIIPNASKITINGTYRARQPSAFGAASDNRFFSNEFTDYNLGATYAVAVGDRLRLGATLFGRYTDSQFSEQATSNRYAFNGVVQGSDTHSSTAQSTTRSLWSSLGVQAGLSREVWFGLAVSTPSFLHSGQSRTTFTNDVKEQDISTHEDISSEGTYEQRLPLALTAGLSYERASSFGLALDVTHVRGLDDGERSRGVAHFYGVKTGELIRDFYRRFDNKASLNPVTNIAVGAEVWAARWLAVRLGGFTAFSSLDDPDPAVDPSYVGASDTFGITGGVGLMLGPTETSIGVSYQRSQGKMTVPDGTTSRAAPNTLADYTINTVLFMLAGAVSIEEARDQIKGTLPKGAQQPPLPGGASVPLELP